ncbi:MAG: cohesin domain-containing protein [bacterium]
MFKKIIFCVCLFFVVSIFIIDSAYALGLGFNPSAQTVALGDNATVEITIDTFGFGLLSGYDLLIDYDPFILNIENNDISLNTILEGVVVYSSEIEVDPNSGTIYLSVLYDYCSDEVIEQPEFLSLATLDFFASEEGTSDLEFLSVTLYDDFLWASLSYDITNPDALAEITTNGEITIAFCPPPDPPSATPEPSTLILLGLSSLIGLGYSKRKKV